MSAPTRPSKGFTGWHMLAGMCLFFGVIITVNLTMATYAIKSWTGLVVKNSYVASQQFNEKAEQGKVQAALGWKGTLSFSKGSFVYRLVDANGNLVGAKGATVQFRRPVNEAEDVSAALVPGTDGALQADVDLHDGGWIAEIITDAGRAEPYHQITRFVVSNGVSK